MFLVDTIREMELSPEIALSTVFYSFSIGGLIINHSPFTESLVGALLTNY